jgi:hypothetical protein
MSDNNAISMQYCASDFKATPKGRGSIHDDRQFPMHMQLGVVSSLIRNLIKF